MGAVKGRSGPWASRVLALVFCVGIALPAADQWFGLVPELQNTEKRILAELPSLVPAPDLDATPGQRLAATLDGLAAFPRAYESWFDDHFGFRSYLIRWHNVLKARLLHTAPHDEVVIGKDGWLYFAGQLNIEQYRQLTPMSERLMKGWQRYLEQLDEWLDDRDTAFLVVIAPSKPTIHPEHLPDSIRRVGRVGRLDQFLAYFRRETDLWILELRPPLLEAKQRGPVYQRTDTHWNSLGSFTAYRAIMRELVQSERFPTLSLPDPSHFESVPRDIAGGDIAVLMGLTDLYPDHELWWKRKDEEEPFVWQQEGLVPSEHAYHQPYLSVQQDASLPRLVLFHDSFGPYLADYLPWDFSHAAFYWQYQPSPELVARERPDLVIQEMGERVLIRDELIGGDKPFPVDPRIGADFERRRAFRASHATLRREEGRVLTAPAELVLPALEATDEVLARVDVVSSAPTRVVAERALPEAAARTLEARELLEGRDVVYLRLSAADCAAGVRLRFEPADAALELRSLELRAR